MNGKALKVLRVEDNAVSAQFVKTMLDAQGYFGF
jgi:hypothetical protein